MSVREGIMAGVPVRVVRVSFTGELSYEIHVACDRVAHLWQAVMQAGEPFGISAYGTQAMHVPYIPHFEDAISREFPPLI